MTGGGRQARRRFDLSAGSPWWGRAVLERGAHLGALWAFAVAQPLFDLLGSRPEFFATRGSGGGAIAAFALVVILVPPLVLLGVEWLAGLVSVALAWAFHPAVVAVLVAALALRVVERDSSLTGFGIALALGVAAAMIYAWARPARSFLSVLSPAALVFVALFLLFSDVSKLVFPDGADVQADTARVPVVLVIFDELPVHSLMAADGRLDARRFPNFARLARDATWYRNTTSVAQDTPYAVPAILDARLPVRSACRSPRITRRLSSPCWRDATSCTSVRRQPPSARRACAPRRSRRLGRADAAAARRGQPGVRAPAVAGWPRAWAAVGDRDLASLHRGRQHRRCGGRCAPHAARDQAPP